MKKIFILTAVFALLSMSLNAQNTLSKYGEAGQPKSQTSKGSMKAPNRANRTTLTVVSSDFNDASWWTIIDANNDGKTWSISSGYASYSYHSTNAANDWLVTPSVALEAGKTYTFNLNAWRGSTTWAEKLEVKFATANTETALSAGTPIITETTVSSASQTSPDALSNTFTVPTSGNYYIGIHATSDADKLRLNVDNMVITTESFDPMIIASTNSVNLKAAPNETANQTITVTGENLTDGITATISGTDAALFSVSPASLGTPGGTLTITYSPTAVGTHTATLTLTSTGADPVTITLNGSCVQEKTICDGTATDEHLPVYGYYFEKDQINQMVYPASELASLVGTKITSMTFYPTNGINFRKTSSTNGTVTFSLGMLTPSNSDVYDDSPVRKTGYTEVATITLPEEAQSNLREWVITFATPFEYTGGDLLLDVQTDHGTYGSTTFSGQSTDYYQSYWYRDGGTATRVKFLPKVTFAYEDSQPRHDLGITLSEPTAVVAGETATITATVTNHGNQTESGYTVTFSDGTTTFSTQTGGTLAPGATETFTATYTTTAAGTVTITANVACTDDATPSDNSATTNLTVNAQVHDLGIALSAPAEIVGGNTATVTATVTNTGNQPMTGYTVTFSDGTTTFSTQTASEPLAPGATATFTADYATTEAQVGTTVNFTATVACTGDEDATNNSATASMSVFTLPPPENVVANPDNDNMTATVTWSAPSDLPTETTTTTETVTEDFEDTSVFPAFSLGGITATQHTGAFGDWIIYEPSGDFTYGITNYTYDNQDGPGAWQVFNPTTIGWTNGSANSGDQYMISFCDAGNPKGSNIQVTDHWLISPELSGNAQTISFYERVVNTTYGGETFEVMYSTTDNNPSSFTAVGNSITSENTSWNLRTVQLPADAKYFAIHHISNDVFGFLIDDVKYEITRTETVTLAPESYNVYLDGVLVGNVDADDPLTYTFNDLSADNYTVEISAVYPGNIESAKVPATFTLVGKTSTPTISGQVVGNNYVITATATAPDTDAEVTLTVTGQQPVTGTGSVTVTIPLTDANQTVTATATAQASPKLESDEASETFAIPFLQTAAPSISVSEPDANGNVVVTATGDGTVTLTTSDGQSVSGSGSVSITLPQQAHDYTVTAEAQAQESGKAASEVVTQSVTVPGRIDDTWKEMTGTYTNDNDVLSFLTIVNGDTTDIMMVDQFMVSTLKNDHPDHYNYVMTETINGEVKYSNEVDIPVYKTNSSIQGLYTQTQVDSLDLKMGLRANVVNTKMDYDVNPDHNVLYYSLYRSDLDATYPEITVDSRISQLQKFEDNVDGNIQYYMFENHPTGVAPRYDHLGYEIAERLDTNWVECDFGQKLAYVPVIWTFGLYSGREDGKNNSYGSDIKREELGAVTVTVEGKHSDGSSMGKFTYDGQEYCIYHPVFNIEATAPQTITQGDGDVCTYVPYMYRAWCTYEGMRDYTADENGLKDNGPLAAPYLLGEEVTTNSQCHIGKNWTQGDGRLQNGFAIPTSVPDGDVTFIVRFYYKKEVAEAQSNGNKLRLGNGEGEEYFIAQAPADGDSMVTGISELMNGVTPVSVTYVNTQGMKSDQPFDGVNIVVTRYSDGSTVTSKVIR